MICFQDMLDHVLAYAGDDATANATTKHRRAVQQAYAVMANRHTWLYLWTLGRITTNGNYTTGTVVYDHTGGANERQLTLAGGTWPDWAAYGYVVINSVPYTVATRISDTVVTLPGNNNPGADVASTTFNLLRDSYPLPDDFVAGDETVANGIGTVLEYVHPRAWASERRMTAGPGTPVRFSYIGDPTRLGSLKMVLTPPPDGVYYIDFLYRRKPRQMFYEALSQGTVTAGTANTTVTGTGTNFASRMIGSVIRFGANNKDIPTGLAGGLPCLWERTITAVASGTSLTIDAPLGENLTSVKSVITDPVDIDELGMVEYMLRECENQYRIAARSKIDKLDEAKDYGLAFTRAMENDMRTTTRAAALRKQSRRSGLLYYPLDFGVIT